MAQPATLEPAFVPQVALLYTCGRVMVVSLFTQLVCDQSGGASGHVST